MTALHSPDFVPLTIQISLNRCSYNCSQSEEEEKAAPLCTDIETKVKMFGDASHIFSLYLSSFFTPSAPSCFMLMRCTFSLSVFCCALPGLGRDVWGGHGSWQEQCCCQQLHQAAILSQTQPSWHRRYLGRGEENNKRLLQALFLFLCCSL